MMYQSNEKTLFEAWKEHGHPLPPFHFYYSHEFEFETEIVAVIFSRPGVTDEASFYTKTNDLIAPDIKIASFHVNHSRKYEGVP